MYHFLCRLIRRYKRSLTKSDYNRTLSNECADNDYFSVKDLLRDHKDLNLIEYGNGAALKRAIKHACDDKQTEKYRSDALKILSALIDYYKEQNFSGDPKSETYKTALNALEAILLDAYESFPFTDGIKAIVKPYCVYYSHEEKDDEKESERDENFDETDEAYGSLENIHTERSLPREDTLLDSAEIVWPEHLLHFRHQTEETAFFADIP